MKIILKKVTDPQVAAKAVLNTELREKSNPGIDDQHLTFHWGDVNWLEIQLEDGTVLGYTYYNKVTNILAELHGFAQSVEATKHSLAAMQAICEYLKTHEGVRKVFVTMPSTATHVGVYLLRAGFTAAAKISKGIVYNQELVDLYYLTKEL